MTSKRAYLSLGSNLGDRQHNLDQALTFLEREGVHIVARSSLYETEPQDVAAQPWFLNIAVECETKLFPLQLLTAVLRIEREMGRVRRLPRGPRLIDLDILLLGNVVMDTTRLSIPHPRMLDRRFVLEPLVEIAPGLSHPVTKRPLRDYLAQVKTQKLRLMPPLSR